MQAYQQGNIEAFEALYDRYRNRLERFLRFRLSAAHRHFLDDLFQITWMKIHRSRKNFDLKQKFSTWLYQIALNSLRDHVSLKHFNEEIIVDEIEANPSFSEDPTFRIDFERAKLYLEKLPHIQREIILLSDLEGFTSTEIARMLNMKEDAIRKVLSRVRKKLRESLEGIR